MSKRDFLFGPLAETVLKMKLTKLKTLVAAVITATCTGMGQTNDKYSRNLRESGSTEVPVRGDSESSINTSSVSPVNKPPNGYKLHTDTYTYYYNIIIQAVTGGSRGGTSGGDRIGGIKRVRELGSLYKGREWVRLREKENKK